MQEREFEKAMSGNWNDAKWADLTEQKELREKIAPMTERLKQMPLSKKEVFRKEIQKNEVVIPQHVSEEIQMFVDQQRRWSVPEQNIRRKVKKKFGIIVIR